MAGLKRKQDPESGKSGRSKNRIRMLGAVEIVVPLAGQGRGTLGVY